MDFENFRLGMWKNSYSDNLNWKFHKGHTQTKDTGPSRDHTSGKGNYFSLIQMTEQHLYKGENAVCRVLKIISSVVRTKKVAHEALDEWATDGLTTF